jgi:DNA polymerase I-like protein with 3'-5' exonuclease and polymerase domains
MLRELFIAEHGYRVVGADSAGNQLRGLCHYVGDKSYTNLVVNGDQHARNAVVLGCSRSIAKSFLYAILFGAGDAKLGQALTGVSSAPKGKEARKKFMANLPGFEQLVDKLKGVFNHYGCIPGLDGRKIYARSDYQVLNYLLQTTEGITCKAALSYAMNKIKEEKLDAYPAIFYHDEQAWIVSDKDSHRVGEILQESFREAPKWFGVECMDGGDYVIGNSYAEVH